MEECRICWAADDEQSEASAVASQFSPAPQPEEDEDAAGGEGDLTPRIEAPASGDELAASQFLI
eukprot:5309105-Heterocapsa_arctica.AAC.1